MKLYLNLCLLVVVFQAGLHAEVRYKVVPILQPPGLDSWAIASKGINDNGTVVGTFGYFYSEGTEAVPINRGYLFCGGATAVELGWMPGFVTYAEDVNNAGQLLVNVRSVPHADLDPPWRHEAHRFTPGVGFEALGDFGGEETEAEAINAAGQVTGYSDDTDGGRHAFRYTDGVGMEDIGTNFTLVSRGFAINDQGWVAGYGDGNAFLFRDDQGVINIGPGRAYGINNKGTVVGVSWVSANDRGLIYRNGEVMVVGPEDVTTLLFGINEHDVVVGQGVRHVQQWDNLLVGLIWNKTEGLIMLNSLIPADSGWMLGGAAAINEHGQITGWGEFENKNLAYRLDPIPPKLSIGMGKGTAVVTWTPAWPGLVLESSPSLASPHWRPVATGGTNVVAVPVEESSRFFRLNLDGIQGLCCPP